MHKHSVRDDVAKNGHAKLGNLRNSRESEDTPSIFFFNAGEIIKIKINIMRFLSESTH